MALGLLLWFVVIPGQTETVSCGWTRPATVPKVMAAAIALGGLLTLLRPVAVELPSPGDTLRAVLLAGLMAAAVAVAHRIGFLWTAPGLALALALIAGERRAFWLAVVTVAVPAFLWPTVVHLLERPLP